MSANTERAYKMAKALTPAVNTLLLARALHAVEKERMDKLDVQLMAEMNICDKTGARITNPDLLYLCAGDMTAYYAERGRRIVAMGYDLDPSACPACIAEMDVVRAKHALLDESKAFFPEFERQRLLCAGLDKYNEAIDLLTKLCVNAPGYRAPILIGGAE